MFRAIGACRFDAGIAFDWCWILLKHGMEHTVVQGSEHGAFSVCTWCVARVNGLWIDGNMLLRNTLADTKQDHYIQLYRGVSACSATASIL